MNTRVSGIKGEAEAYAYIVKLGMKPISKNYRRAGGEIDLIAMDGNTVVFIEVKARLSSRYGAPQEAVTGAKMRAIARTALYFMKENHMLDVSARFDVIALEGENITYIRNAFDATGLL